MARRRSKAKPPQSPRGTSLAWAAVVLVSAGLGWAWWRAVYPTVEERSAAIRAESPTPSPVPAPPRAFEPAESNSVSAPGAGHAPVLPAQPVVVVPNFPREELPVAPAVEPPPAVQNMADVEPIVGVQLALARHGISCGPIDGVVGSQTHAALRVFQKTEGLAVTGQLDAATLARLQPNSAILEPYVVTPEDLARLTSVPSSWLAKSTRERLDYETPLELVAEKSHSHPRLIRSLNPGVDWDNVKAGTVVQLPNVPAPRSSTRAAIVRINLGEKILSAFDSNSNLLLHAPCSIARRVEKRPVGELHVAKVAVQPSYQFDPEIFTESSEARRIGHKLTIPPGPNNPVGTAWIGLDRPGYGIHGTPNPTAVGRTESHGCFRLANWDAERLANLVWTGMPVFIEP